MRGISAGAAILGPQSVEGALDVTNKPAGGASSYRQARQSPPEDGSDTSPSPRNALPLLLSLAVSLQYGLFVCFVLTPGAGLPYIHSLNLARSFGT